MARALRSSRWLSCRLRSRRHAVSSLAFADRPREQQLTTADYPNGAEAPGEKPCAGGDGSACCPDKWACLDNGLCYYEPSNLYGRYSCTDKDWKAEGCPSNLCTNGKLRAGVRLKRKAIDTRQACKQQVPRAFRNVPTTTINGAAMAIERM